MKHQHVLGYRFLLLLVWVIFSVLKTNAQDNPVSISVQVIPPYSPYFSDYIGESGNITSGYNDLIMVTLQNTDMSSSYQLKLIPKISSNTNVSVEVQPGFTPTRPISLAPGETRVLNMSDLKGYNSNLNNNHVAYSGVSYNELVQTGVLPEGNYTVCIQAYDYNTSTPLSNSEPGGCSAGFLVSHPDPPQITFPVNGSELLAGDPQNLQFSWTPPAGGSGNYQYNVRIVELSGTQQDPYFVMNNSNYAFYREQGLMVPSLLYDMSKPTLKPGNTYAVRVTANDPQSQTMIKNQGQSEIHVFRVQQDTTLLADTTSEETAEEQPAFACGGDCDFDLSGVDRTPVTTFQTGDIIKVGHYEVQITGGNWSGDQLTGEGKILATDYIPVAVNADLINLQINSNGRAFNGKVQAQAGNTNLFNQSMLSDMAGQINLPQTDPSILFNQLSDPGRLLANLQNEATMDLPLGIGAPGDYYTVALVGMVLRPEKATINTAAMMAAPEEQNKYLAFGAKKVCINPSGLAASDSIQMSLLEDVNIRFSDDVSMKLSKTAGNAGTYATAGCEGFGRVYAQGDLIMSPEVMRYENPDGTQNTQDTVKLSFATSFSDWSDWLIAANLFDENRRYQFPEVEDYSFRIQQMVLDHSDLRNDPSLVFPDQYASADRNATWKGLYIKTFNMMMPRFIDKNDDQRIELTGRNILIDQHGVSTFIEANDVLTQNEGRLGDWAFSMDYLALELVASRLDSASMKGELLMPISDSSFSYTTHMSYLNSRLDYDFNLVTADVINVPMWYAQMDLYESSELDLTINTNNEVTIQAILNGKLNLDSEVGDFDQVKIGGLEFEQLVLRNKPQYIRMDGAMALDASASPSLMGFGLNLGGNGSGSNSESGALNGSLDIGLDEVSSRRTALFMDMGINFTGKGESNSLAGNTRISLEARYNPQQVKWENASASIEQIELDANMGIMDIYGMIRFFKDNPVYGKGFQGTLNSRFLETINVDVNGLFGSVDDYRYFYVDGKASFGVGGLGFFGLGMYGFGGGVAYNMENTSLPTTDDIAQNTSGVQSDYEPKDGSMALKATVMMGLQGDPKPWNSDVTFEVGWNNQSGLTRIDIGGDSYFMQELADRSNPKFKGTLDMTYNFNQQRFMAAAQTDIRIPAQDPNITGNMPANFLFDFQRGGGLSEWYIKFGEPSDRIITHVAITEGISFTNGSYFMTGSNIPGMPPPPPAILQELDISQSSQLARPNNHAIEAGAGFAHGLKLDFELNEMDAVICNIDARLIAGYDISVMDWSKEGILCNGRSEFGVNDWYAKGQLYFLASAHFYGKGPKEMTYFRTSLAALAQGGLPNPTGVRGKVQATFEVGWKTWKPSKEFYIGEICEMSIPEDAEPDIENPYQDTRFISRVSPDQGRDNISPIVVPEVEFNYPVEKIKNFTFPDGMGGTVSKTYKIGYDLYIRENGSSNRIDLSSAPSGTNRELEITMNEQLKPETAYEIAAEATLLQKSGNNWNEVREGNRIVHEKVSNTFITGKKEKFSDIDIAEMTPVKRQRYFKKGDHPQGLIRFRTNMDGFFNQYSGKQIQVKFTSLDESDEHVVDASLYSDRLTYPMPDLNKETIYSVKIIAVDREEESSTSSGYGWFGNNGFAFSVLNNSGSSQSGSSQSGSGSTQSGGFSTGVQSTQYNFNTNATAAEDLELDPTVFAPVLYEYHFRTSMFNTLGEKLNSLQDAEVSLAYQNVGAETAKKLTIRLQGPERFEGYLQNRNNELEFEEVTYRLEHNNGVEDNFLPDWYLNNVNYTVNSSQSWTEKVTYQVLRQTTPYEAFGQDPYQLKGYWQGSGILPSYFDGPLSDRNIQYGWEPDYSNSGNSTGYGYHTSSNTQNINFSTSGTFVNASDLSLGNDTYDASELTTVMAVEVTLERKILREFQNETVPAVEVAKQYEAGGPGQPGGATGTSGGMSTTDLESAQYLTMPNGNYQIRLRMTEDNTLTKTVYFNF